MRKLYPYLAIATLLATIIYSIDTYRAKNPIEIEEPWLINMSDSTID